MSMFAAANCDNGDTVVSVNFGYDSTAMDVQMNAASMHITITPHSGGGRAVTADADVNHDDAGAITSAVYKRVTVNGLSGMVDVTVDAKDSGSSTLLTASTTVELVQHGAVAAFVKFARAATPDAGADAGEATGGTTGSGGAGGSGGAVGSGGAGETGGAVGSGGTTSAGGVKGSGGSTGSGGMTAAGPAGSGGNRGTGGA